MSASSNGGGRVNNDVEAVMGAAHVLVAPQRAVGGGGRRHRHVGSAASAGHGHRPHRTQPRCGGERPGGASIHATRAVDRLVSAGLPNRSDDPTDRRNLVLSLTANGQGLVDRVMGLRRDAIAAILDRMPPARRRSLVPVMRAFAEAGGEPGQRGVVARLADVEALTSADGWNLGRSPPTAIAG
jgi:hypothetical protein